ncbi:MAG TPA: class I SAM-dependent methyltransferase [Gaiellaceae bacterium]|nr:class I SAM-dependent methyltransferase [Gaiellaceae bacterium]
MKREDWDRRYASGELPWRDGPHRVLVAEAADLPPGRALDLACGEGRNAVWLLERGWSVLGVDFSRVAIATARSRAAEAGLEADFRCADLLEFVPDREAYDLVIVFYLQLPAPERTLVLGRAVQAVAPGGTVLVLGHDADNITDGVGGPSDPSVLYTPDDLVADLDGLEIERAERLLREVENADRPAIDAFVRAHAEGARGRGSLAARR